MEYTVTRNAGPVVIAISGRLTFSDMPNFAKLVAAVGAAGDRGCVIDLGGLDQIDSTGMSLFVHAYDAARAGATDLSIRNARGMVLDALMRAGFPKLMRMA